jgi:hypothetical protein
LRCGLELFKLTHYRVLGNGRKPISAAPPAGMLNRRAVVAARRASLRRPKAEGKQLGRPRISAEIEKQILAALRVPDRTEGVRKIAKRFGVDPGKVQRISRPLEGASTAAGSAGMRHSYRVLRSDKARFANCAGLVAAARSPF